MVNLPGIVTIKELFGLSLAALAGVSRKYRVTNFVCHLRFYSTHIKTSFNCYLFLIAGIIQVQLSTHCVPGSMLDAVELEMTETNLYFVGWIMDLTG